MAKAPTGKRYAQALFQLAQERGREKAWEEELRQAQSLLADSTVYVYLTTPRVRPEQKQDAVRQLLAGLDPMIVNLVGLLSTRRAILVLPPLIDAYSALLNQSLGRVQAAVISAIALSDQQESHLQTLLSQTMEREVVLEVREEPEIIGGLVVRVGDQVVDGSIRTRLRSLRQRLAQATI